MKKTFLVDLMAEVYFSFFFEQKNAVCIQTSRAYTGIGDAETQSPGMLRKPGDLP